jgi:hypothetical protein
MSEISGLTDARGVTEDRGGWKNGSKTSSVGVYVDKEVHLLPMMLSAGFTRDEGFLNPVKRTEHHVEVPPSMLPTVASNIARGIASLKTQSVFDGDTNETVLLCCSRFLRGQILFIKTDFIPCS